MLTAQGHWANHPYYRHSVDRDVVEFCGWDKLEELFNQIQDPAIRMICIASFLLAGRISEILSLRRRMFVVEDNEVRVYNYPMVKRWKSKGFTLVCTRCGTENQKFDLECSNCKANLVYSQKETHH